MRRWPHVVPWSVGAFALRLALLLRTEEPLGTDGYYYVVQVEHALRDGRFHAPESSWVLWFFTALGALFPPALAVKVGAALLGAATVATGAWLVAAWCERLRVSSVTPVVAAAAWLAVSPTLTFVAGEFPKNLGAIPPLLACGALLAQEGVMLRRGLLLAGCALVAFLAHRVGAALVLAGALGVALSTLSARAKAWPRWVWPVVGTTLAILLVFAWRAPNVLHWKDLERVTSALALPSTPPPFAWFDQTLLTPPMKLELALSWLGLGLALITARRQPALRAVSLALALMLAVCLFPFWRTDVVDLGFRLALMTAPLTAVVVATRLRGPPALGHAAGFLALALCLSVWPGRFSTPPYAEYRRLLSQLPRPLPRLLIAHQGLSFLYVHETGEEAMAWAPEPELDRTEVGRVVWGMRSSELSAWLSPDLPPPVRLGLDYVYLREDAWEALVQRAEAEGDDDVRDRLVDWRNPRQARPASLSRNHPAP